MFMCAQIHVGLHGQQCALSLPRGQLRLVMWPRDAYLFRQLHLAWEILLNSKLRDPNAVDVWAEPLFRACVSLLLR